VERSVVEHTAILALLEDVAATESAVAVAKAAEEAEAAARVVSYQLLYSMNADSANLLMSIVLTELIGTSERPVETVGS
jgi:hypothetical protein